MSRTYLLELESQKLHNTHSKSRAFSIIYFMLGNHDCLQTNMAHWRHIRTLAVNKVWPKVAN